MAKRPIETKQRRRAAKALRRRPLPAYFDLVQWLVEHGHAGTKRLAREMILAKRVRSDSHPIGFKHLPVMKDGVVAMEDVVVERVPVSARANILITDA